MGQFLLTENAGETFPLARADGGAILIQPGVGAGASGALELIFPNIAALEAYNASSPQVLKQGQLAYVQSNNSWWVLTPAVEGLVDNITVASVTAPPVGTFVWERWASGAVPSYLAQTAWFVDPNAATNADEATGLDAAHPIKTFAEIYRRLGYNWAPEYKVLVTVTLLNNQLTPADPWLFQPIGSGGLLLLTAALPAPAMTATLSGVAPKNRTAVGGQPLETQFTVTTGGPGVGMLLVNTTRGNSRSMIGQDLGGGVFALNQPLVPIAPNTFPTLTEVDTWANGDTILGYFPVAANVPLAGGLVDEFSNIGAVQFYQVTIFDPSEQFDPCTVALQSGAFFLDCPFGRPMSINGPGTPEQPFFINCTFPFGASGNANAQFAYEIDACSFTGPSSFEGGALIQHDSWFGGTSQTHTMRFGRLGFVAVLGGNTLTISGATDLGSVSDSGVVYGAGILDPNPGTLTHTGTAVTQLTCTLHVRGNAEAYGVVSAAGETKMFPLGVSAAALDAPAGPVGAPTGFGGLAFNPAGGSFYKSGVTP